LQVRNLTHAKNEQKSRITKIQIYGRGKKAKAGVRRPRGYAEGRYDIGSGTPGMVKAGGKNLLRTFNQPRESGGQGEKGMKGKQQKKARSHWRRKPRNKRVNGREVLKEGNK